MSVFVTGATGKIGEVLVQLLIQKGVAVTAYVRDAGKGAAKLAGAKLATGTIEDTHAFSAAIKGHERLFLLTNAQHLESGLAHAAKAAGVKHIVRISCWLASSGAEPGTIFNAHGHVEEQLKDLGIAVTTLRPADFMQNFLTSAGSIKGQGAFYTNLLHETKVASIDVFDIANTAAAVLTQPIEAHAGLGYTLTGPVALTKNEVAEAASKHIGKPVKAVFVDDASLFKALQGFGLPPRWAFLLVNLGQIYRKELSGPGWATGSVEIITGQKPRSWDDFLSANKGAFQ